MAHLTVVCGNCGHHPVVIESTGERVRCPACTAVVYEPYPDDGLPWFQ